MKDIAIGVLRRKLEVAQKEKDGIQLTIEKLENPSKSLNKLIYCQIVNNGKKGLGYENYNAVPPSYTGNFMPSKPKLSFTSLNEFANKHVDENVKAKSSKEESKATIKKFLEDMLLLGTLKEDKSKGYVKKINPTIYVSCIEQFWSTVVAKTINGEAQIHARVDGKKIIISEASIRRDLQFAEEEGVDFFYQILQSLNNLLQWEHVANEAVHKELGDSLVRAATTASSLEAEQDSGAKKPWGIPLLKLGLRVYLNILMIHYSQEERRIDDINDDEDITLVNVLNDADKEMFNADKDLGGEEIKGVVIQDPSESKTTTTTTFSVKQKSQDKGKGIMVEEPMKPKKKDQIRLDEEVALRLQDKFDKEERLAIERAQKEPESNIALIKTWDDVQAKINVDHQLAKRLQAEKQQKLSDAEKDTLFMQLLEKRRKFIAAKRAEDKRDKQLIQAQQRKIMCT
nr:hypothetical protein [Tanacetum cinerariifolium]GEW78156.1 hypothetical protein [Tanacetum cinerariifolium]